MNVECMYNNDHHGLATKPRAELLTRHPGKSLGSGDFTFLSIWWQIRSYFHPLPVHLHVTRSFLADPFAFGILHPLIFSKVATGA